MSGEISRLSDLDALRRAARRAELSNADAILGPVEGIAAYVGQNGIRSEKVRRAYQGPVRRLAGDASDQRTSLKVDARRVTPAPQRVWLNHVRPDVGKGEGSGGGAARTNPVADAQARQLGRRGRASLVSSLALGGVEIAAAKDKARAASGVAGGLGGGVAGGIAGAEAGTIVGSLFPGLGTVAGAVGGGIFGSLGGGAAGRSAGLGLHDRIRGRAPARPAASSAPAR